MLKKLEKNIKSKESFLITNSTEPNEEIHDSDCSQRSHLTSTLEIANFDDYKHGFVIFGVMLDFNQKAILPISSNPKLNFLDL